LDNGGAIANLWVNGVFGFSSFVNRVKLEKFLVMNNIDTKVNKGSSFFAEKLNGVGRLSEKKDCA
jgi:hypothetical protein